MADNHSASPTKSSSSPSSPLRSAATPRLRQRRRQLRHCPPEIQAAQRSRDRALPPIQSPPRQSSARYSNKQGKVHHTPVRPFQFGKETSQQQEWQQRIKKRLSAAYPDTLLLHPSRDEEYFGWMSPWAWLWGTIFLTIPIAYIYIVLVLLRELCRSVPALAQVLTTYVPPLAKLVKYMSAVSWIVEAWCILEALFYVALKLHIRWLQTRDTLEASLSAAPLMDLTSRRVLWQRMMETEAEDTAAWLQGWLLDPLDDLQQLHQGDVRGFICWSMFEGRRTEHLTIAEAQQLESFVDELQHRLSLQFYGSISTPPLSSSNEDQMDFKARGQGQQDEIDDSSSSPATSTASSQAFCVDLPEDSHDSGYDPWKVPRFVDLPQPRQGKILLDCIGRARTLDLLLNIFLLPFFCFSGHGCLMDCCLLFH